MIKIINLMLVMFFISACKQSKNVTLLFDLSKYNNNLSIEDDIMFVVENEEVQYSLIRKVRDSKEIERKVVIPLSKSQPEATIRLSPSGYSFSNQVLQIFKINDESPKLITVSLKKYCTPQLFSAPKSIFPLHSLSIVEIRKKMEAECVLYSFIKPNQTTFLNRFLESKVEYELRIFHRDESNTQIDLCHADFTIEKGLYNIKDVSSNAFKTED